MQYEITTRDLAAQPIVSIRERLPQSDIPAFLGRSFGDLFGRLGLLGAAPMGPPFVIYHEFAADAIDAEVCVPVSGTIAASGHIQARTLLAMAVASTLHVGPYEECAAAYDALTEWISRTGHEAAGPMLERYLNGPGDVTSPAEYRTQIEVPIERAAVAVAG
ncbi:MAG TPA: GyrI-like domain-containing protein [Candidatus Limnocylindrales bacterium]|nr:GyrI-like domain-containing protein [Candidatus Limnocylindrales bacterium]